MTYEQFVFWLKGYLEGNKTIDKKLIKDKLETIYTSYTALDSNITTNFNSNNFYEQCGCNPKNGGNGVCNCTLNLPVVNYANKV